jgi:hypothetical protein
MNPQGVRLAGQMLDPATLAAISHGFTALGAGLSGRERGLSHPESHPSGAGSLISAGLAAVPGAIMGGAPGAASGAFLGYMADRIGHGVGRQQATDHMLGPGVNANTIAWHRVPGT